MSNWRFAMNRYILPGGWRIANPFSFLSEFEKWFEFECFMVGFFDAPPEGAFPDNKGRTP